jgi:hypothetical protein
MHIDKIQKCHQSWQDCCYKLVYPMTGKLKNSVSSFGMWAGYERVALNLMTIMQWKYQSKMKLITFRSHRC